MKYALVLLLIVSLWLVSCTPAVSNVSENKLCQKDADCVPASCCHAKEAVNSQNAPKCEGMLCTMECVPETLDCGQGEIKCVKNECKVVLK
ncbi:MAG: hypothetical protein AABX04_00530 [Nanoarchaeota archaeon]